MEEILRIDYSALNKMRIEIKKVLKQKYDFYNTIILKDATAIGMPSRDGYEAAESLEECLATFYVVRECASRYLISSASSISEDTYSFLNMFATYAGISKGMEMLKFDLPELKHELSFISFSEGSPSSPEAYLDTIISSYIHSIKNNANTGTQIKGILSILYGSLEEKILKEKSAYPGLEAAISSAVLSLDGIKIKGFSRYKNGKKAEPEMLTSEKGESTAQITFQDIIGNSEAKSALQRYAEMLFLYSPKERNNPILKVSYIPRTVFLYARPGTGKTSLAAAMRNYMRQLSEQSGKKFSWVTIDSSIKKKWYGETEEILRTKTREAMSPEGVGVVFIDDIDGLVVSRSGSEVNAPDRSMTIYLMQIIEGIDTSYYGNYLILSASNKPSDLDEALLERIGEASFKVPGPQTEAEYAEFLISKLRKGIDAGYVNISREGFFRAAELCMNYSEVLSPRELTKALKMLQEKACSTIDYARLRSLEVKDLELEIKKGISKIGELDLIEAIEGKYREELLQKEISRKFEVRKIAEELEKREEAIALLKSRGEKL
ncbi:MAG: AAA family ATPase [Candidatus Woesearchaeota archaeon]